MIINSIKAVENSNIEVSDHFADVGKMVDIGVSERDIQDVALSRKNFWKEKNKIKKSPTTLTW